MNAPHPDPAHPYVVGWRRVALVLMCLGWLITPLVADVTTVVILCIVGILASVVVVTLLDVHGWRRRAPSAPSVYGAVVGAGAVVASATAVRTLGPSGWSVVAAVAVSSPLVVSRFVDLRATAVPTHDEVLPVTNVLVSSTMSTADLVHAWRGSFSALARARTSTARAAVAARRAEYLDELERRHPEAMRRWLRSGARAAGDPSPFLSGRAPDSPS